MPSILAANVTRKPIQLSQAAANDIREIESYTLLNFGKKQTLQFVEKLEASLSLIATIPDMGMKRPEFDPPHYQFRYQAVLSSFVVVYEETADSIRIARIIHGARNLLSELMRNSGNESSD